MHALRRRASAHRCHDGIAPGCDAGELNDVCGIENARRGYLDAFACAMVTPMPAETAFSSDARFDQPSFLRWLRKRPASDLNHYELIDGRIVVTPPAGWPHGCLDATLSRLLHEHVQRHRLGVVQGSSAGYNLPSGDTLEPDVSFISAARFAAGPPPSPGQFLAIVPTLVVEILSRATSRRDRSQKKSTNATASPSTGWSTR
jgi:Uma2 family endonuclease